MSISSFYPLAPALAVHISDGVLGSGCCGLGLVLAALLIAVASWPAPTEEEIVRIALLTAAFFVATLIHVNIGPTSVHLLFNGLVGVMLGWRAGLAIATALLLQAALLAHGGMSTLGVNMCVLTLPALLGGGLFTVLNRPGWLSRSWYRALLVGCATAVWSLAAVFSIALLASNRLSLRNDIDPQFAVQATFYPATLAAVGGLALFFAWLESRFDHAPEFPVGLLVGLVSVVATTALNTLALHWGGSEDWGSLVLVVFVAHLPIAAIEGLILGFIVGFLARVKPELIGLSAMPALADGTSIGKPTEPQQTKYRSPALPLALLAALLAPSTVRAHRLDVDYRLLPDGVVEIDCWFSLGGSTPRGALVQVFGSDDTVVADGKIDEKGQFRFQRSDNEALRVVVNAGAGHRTEVQIPGNAAESSADGPLPRSASERRAGNDDLTRAAVGLGLIFALAGFALGIRNARAIRGLREMVIK